MSDTESSEAKPYSSRNAMSDTESSEAKPYFSRNAMSDTESSRVCGVHTTIADSLGFNMSIIFY